MDSRKLPPNGLRTAADMDRKLWSEVVSLNAAITARLNGNADLYETGRLAEQMARRLGRLHALRQQVAAHNATLNKRRSE